MVHLGEGYMEFVKILQVFVCLKLFQNKFKKNGNEELMCENILHFKTYFVPERNISVGDVRSHTHTDTHTHTEELRETRGKKENCRKVKHHLEWKGR